MEYVVLEDNARVVVKGDNLTDMLGHIWVFDCVSHVDRKGHYILLMSYPDDLSCKSPFRAHNFNVTVSVVGPWNTFIEGAEPCPR